jgi:hypothetical protein
MRPLAISALVVGLCGGLATRVPAERAPHERTVTVTGPDGTSFASTIIGSDTRVERIAPGRELLFELDRPLELRLVDPAGSRLALADPLPDDGDTYRPGGRRSTHIVVADLASASTRSYEIPRNVEPEAFGVGNPVLFLIDHRPAPEPTSYRVAALDLGTGGFHRLFGPDKQPLDLDMTGTARQQVASPSGTQLYTLYLQHGHEDALERADPDELPVAAFVHVLDLAQGWAACVDLPGFGHGPLRAASIAQSPGGDLLYVADSHIGELAVIETRQLDGVSLSGGQPPIGRVDLPPGIRPDARVQLTAGDQGLVVTTRGRVSYGWDGTTWRSG